MSKCFTALLSFGASLTLMRFLFSCSFWMLRLYCLSLCLSSVADEPYCTLYFRSGIKLLQGWPHHTRVTVFHYAVSTEFLDLTILSKHKGDKWSLLKDTEHKDPNPDRLDKVDVIWGQAILSAALFIHYAALYTFTHTRHAQKKKVKT